MKETNCNIEAVRLMLTMRRHIFSEFGTWISVDDDQGPRAIRSYGLQSKDQSLREMANKLGPLLSEPVVDDLKTATSSEKLHYYRGTPLEQSASAKQTASDEQKPQAQAAPEAKPQSPAKKVIYRGQVIYR